MRRKYLLLLTVFAGLLMMCPGRSAAQGDAYVSYQIFYDELVPYGQWLQDSEYGYVWVPNVDEDFRPYFTAGHWVMTDYGNTWMSDYPWGWACFHYGRWTYNEYYGWMWVPGYEWGPGWVAWTWADDFCGWAPLYPGVMWYGLAYTCPEDWWIFMHPRYLYRPRYRNVWRSDFFHGPRHTHVLLRRTHFITSTFEYNNQRFYSGPRPADVTRVTHQPVQVVRMSSDNVRGPETIRNNTLNSYHPARIEQLTKDGKVPAPARVMHAPQPANNRGELKNNWNQPRPFRVEQQRQNPQWNRPFIRNAPPYNPRPAPNTNPRPAPNVNPRPAPSPRQQVTPRSAPARTPTPIRRYQTVR